MVLRLPEPGNVLPQTPRRLRVGYVYRNFNREGSIAGLFLERAERLARDEDVVAFCSSRTRSPTDAPLRFETVEPLIRGNGRFTSALEAASFALRARRALQRRHEELDLIHVVGTSAPHADIISVNAVRPAEIEHYFESVEPRAHLRRRLVPVLRPQSLVVLALESRLFRSAVPPYCITPSNAIARHLIDYYGVPADVVESIPAGVNLRLFRPDGQMRMAVRSRLGVPDERLVLLFVGDDFERKGLGRVIAALTRLETDAELWVAGDDLRSGRRRSPRVVTEAQSVRFLGRVPHDQISELYAACDALVLPSRQDAWGQPVVEALAAGCVVLASEYTGAHEVIVDGINGFVLDRQGSPEQIAAIVDRQVADPSMRAAIGQAAIHTAARFDDDLLYERFRAVHHKAYARRVREHQELAA